MKIRQIIAQVAATMKNADCVPPGRQIFQPGVTLCFSFETPRPKSSVRALSPLPAYYPLAKIPPVGHSKRENTIDGSAIFRAIEQEASRRCCKGKKEGWDERTRASKGWREKESAGVEERRDMLSHAIPSPVIRSKDRTSVSPLVLLSSFLFVSLPARPVRSLSFRRIVFIGAMRRRRWRDKTWHPTRSCLVRRKQFKEGVTASPKRDKPRRVSVRDESPSVLNLESKENADSFRAKDTNSTLW